MSQMNVEQFANELGVLPAVLLEQLQAAGVSKHLTADSLTEKDKTQLLDYLRKIHGAKDEKSKISLPRRQTSEIKKSDSTGKPRSIQVEVRKKRVVVKGDPGDRMPVDQAGRAYCALRRAHSRSRSCPGNRCRTTGVASGGSKEAGRVDCTADCGDQGKETASEACGDRGQRT